jgi:alpha-1,2-mannosyltransferase
VSDQPINVRRHIAIGCYLLVGIYLLVALYLLSGFIQPGWFYRSGVPAGADFLQIWAGSSLAAQGRAAAVYDPAALKQVETAIVGGDFAKFALWHYPPSFLLMMLPLSALNYLAALAVWLFIPLTAFLLILYGIYPDRLTIWLSLASMGTVQNLCYGQGAFLVGALLGGGLLLVDRRPLLAGILFGLVINYKPHLVALILVAFLAGGHWRALTSLAATCAILTLASLGVFGLPTWLAFWHDLPVMRAHLGEADLWGRFPTVFCGVRLLGGGPGLAMALQLLTGLGAVAGVYWVWRRRASLPLRASVLVVGTFLVTPYVLNYDLTLLLLPMAWMAWEGFQRQWGPGEKIMLGLAWLTPSLDLTSVALARIHLAPLILAAWLIYLLTQAARVTPEEKPLTTAPG